MEVKANVYVVFLGLAAGALTLYLADRWVDHIAVAARPAAGNVLLRNENLVLAEHRLGRKVTVVGQPAPAPQVDGDVLPAASVLEQVLPGIVRFVMPGDKAE